MQDYGGGNDEAGMANETLSDRRRSRRGLFKKDGKGSRPVGLIQEVDMAINMNIGKKMGYCDFPLWWSTAPFHKARR